MKKETPKFNPVLRSNGRQKKLHPIENYLKNGLNSIEGWMGTGASHLFLALDEIQKELNIEGNIFEIGVHHGKSSILLGLMAYPLSLSVCDIFNNQNYNLSHSGHGNRKIFESNYELWVGNKKNLIIYESLSSQLEKYAEIDNSRLFYIDGGHTSQETLHDLEFAFNHLKRKGIVVLDDSFNYMFPGVSEGTNRFLLHNRDISPVVIGKNKTVFCNLEFHDFYLQSFFNPKTKYAKKLSKESEFMFKQKYYDNEVLIYGKGKSEGDKK